MAFDWEIIQLMIALSERAHTQIAIAFHQWANVRVCVCDSVDSEFEQGK